MLYYHLNISELLRFNFWLCCFVAWTFYPIYCLIFPYHAVVVWNSILFKILTCWNVNQQLRSFEVRSCGILSRDITLLLFVMPRLDSLCANKKYSLIVVRLQLNLFWKNGPKNKYLLRPEWDVNQGWLENYFVFVWKVNLIELQIHWYVSLLVVVGFLKPKMTDKLISCALL